MHWKPLYSFIPIEALMPSIEVSYWRPRDSQTQIWGPLSVDSKDRVNGEVPWRSVLFFLKSVYYFFGPPGNTPHFLKTSKTMWEMNGVTWVYFCSIFLVLSLIYSIEKSNSKHRKEPRKGKMIYFSQCYKI